MANNWVLELTMLLLSNEIGRVELGLHNEETKYQHISHRLDTLEVLTATATKEYQAGVAHYKVTGQDADELKAEVPRAAEEYFRHTTEVLLIKKQLSARQTTIDCYNQRLHALCTVFRKLDEQERELERKEDEQERKQ